MSRRVATITLNPAYDLVGFCPEIERGEVNLVKTILIVFTEEAANGDINSQVF